MRLNQFIARQTGVSRRQADDIISKKQILVNQQVATLGTKVDPENDVIEILGKTDRKTLKSDTLDQTILFYKPIFCVCTRKDPQKRKTIYNYLPKNYHSLKSAGRLDYMSEGLLVMSNNGQLIDDLTHPKNEHEKVYLVATKNQLTKDIINMFGSGELELEEYKLNPVNVQKLSQSSLQKWSYLKLQPNFNWYKFTLSEGRNNQIRRMCETFGHRVPRLIRVKHGQYELTEQIHSKRYIEA